MSMFPPHHTHQSTSPSRSRCSSYSGNLSPINESSPPDMNEEEEAEIRPLIVNNVSPSLPPLKRKHLNPDCTHFVSQDFQTVISTYPEDDLKPGSSPDDQSLKSWFFHVFWSSPRRKKYSLCGVIVCSCLILAASGYYFFQRPRLQAIQAP